MLPKILLSGYQRLPKAANRHYLLFYYPPASKTKAAVKFGVVIRLTQVLFTWWAGVSSHCCCLETVPMLLIAKRSESTLFRVTQRWGAATAGARATLHRVLPSWVPPVGSHSNSAPGAHAPSQLITKFLMECFPPGWGPSQRGLQSVTWVKPLWLPEHSRSFRVTADVC